MKTLHKLICILALLGCAAIALVPMEAQTVAGPGATALQQTGGMPWQFGGDWKFTSSSTATAGFDVRGISYYRVLWVPVGTVSTCSLSIDSAAAADPVLGTLTSPVIGGIVSAATLGSCAMAGTYVSAAAAGVSAYGQITPTITGSGSVIVVVFGYTENPSATASSGGPLLAATSPENQFNSSITTLYPAILSGTCVFAAGTTCTVTYPTTWASVPVVSITPVNPGAIAFTLTTSSTTQIIITAGSSNSLTVNYHATLPTGSNCTAYYFPLAGARMNADYLIPQWPTAMPIGIIGMMSVTASDLVQIYLCNQTSATIVPSGNFTFGAKVIRQ